MDPKLLLLTPRDYVTTRWSGGTTTQLLIAPEGALYSERDFLWRVSSAAVELEESDFTALIDYRRFISTVRGSMTLSHNGGSELTLYPGDVHEFDGADETHSRGRCTDFNLMLRKGRADGAMLALRLRGGETSFIADSRAECALLYCAEGGVTARLGETEAKAAEGDSLLLRGAPLPALRLESEGAALVMAAQMWAIG